MIFNQILECTIKNNLEIHENSALLVCTTDYIEDIDIIDDFNFNNSYEIVDITNAIDLENLEDLYKYLLTKNISVNVERITNKGILVGENADMLIRSNLRAEFIQT